MNFSSFGSSNNFNNFSREYPSQDSSIGVSNQSQKSSNMQEKLEFPHNEQKASHQVSQNQHAHDKFDEMNQSDVELRSQVQLGSIGHKRIKNEKNDSQNQSDTDGKMRMEEEAKPISDFNMLSIEGMLQRLTLSQDKSNILYQPHQYNEEERNMLLQSLQDMFSKQCKITSSIGEESVNSVTFEYFKFDIRDYTIEEILGAGAHGLVIKLKEISTHLEAVIKLYTEKEAFTRETPILSILQKAKEYELPKPFDLNYPLNPYQNKYFKTDEFYGLFIKAGIGSLLDFKNYLQKTNKELTEKELFVLTFHLLNEIQTLHGLSLCHRDIKPANIVIDPEYFLPKLIDFSLASEMSKAQGNPGTPGYRMEDYKMECQEIEKRDQLIARDYFALGITILNLTFPDCLFLTQKIIKDRLVKLAKFKNIEKKVLAETLELCLFGKTEITKDILKEERKNSFEICKSKEGDEVTKEKLKDISNDFGLWRKLDEYAEELRENHHQSFKDYMAEKWSRSQEKKEPELQKHISSLTLQMRENFGENPVRILEDCLFSNEEQYIRNIIMKNHPELAEEKCYEIVNHLVMIDHQVFDPKLYSTVMAALFLNGFLDDAIALGDKACQYQLVGEHNWILFNNVVYLITQRNLREYRLITPDEYRCCLQYLMTKYKEKFIFEVERVCKSAHGLGIKGCVGVPSFSYSQKGLVLTYFEMDLLDEESYFFMNYCYLSAVCLDKIIDEPTRQKIQKFVYGVNFFERGYMLKFLNVDPLESVVLTLNSFYETLNGGTLEKWAQERISLKNECFELLQKEEEEGDTDKLWDSMLFSDIMQAMIGFIILYNTQYDLTTKFDVNTWISSEETKLLSEEEWNRQFKKLQVEQTKKWNRQEFLDSIILFRREIDGDVFGLKLDFKGEDKHRLTSLSILNKKLYDIVFPDCGNLEESYFLLLSFEENEIFARGIKHNFELIHVDIIERFFANWNLERAKDLKILSLELSHYNEGSSHIPLAKICSQFSVLRLLQLTITMKNEIRLKDEDFKEIAKFISTQYELLIELTLEFNLCLITFEALTLLADAIKEHENLVQLNLALKNCPRIEEESIYIFLNRLKELKSEELRKLPNLQFVNLSLSGCPDGFSYTKPSDLPFQAEVKIDLQEVIKISVDLDALHSEEQHDWCIENYDFEEEAEENGNDLETFSKEKEDVLPESK